VPGHIRPIDVDHIIPKAKAKHGKVLFEGSMIPVDDLRNLQALCTRCNRGKRDTSTTSFGLTEARLVETISWVLDRARELDLDPASILSQAAAASQKSASGSGQENPGS
jgi:hypothetical protein